MMAAGWNQDKEWSAEIRQKISQSMIKYWQEHPEQSLRNRRTEAEPTTEAAATQNTNSLATNSISCVLS